MENKILEANLKCIEKYNPTLAKEIAENTKLNLNIQLIETDLKEPNLTINSFPLHAQSGAENEAKIIFSNAKNGVLINNILFGLGLGYTFQEFCKNAKGFVFLYEPSIDVLRATLEIVDFTKELSQKNVFVASSLKFLGEIFQKNYAYKSETSVAFLPSYKQLYALDFEALIKQIELIVAVPTVEYNGLLPKMITGLDCLIKNMENYFDEKMLIDFKDKFEGETAVIVSAGPSLDRDLETLKKYRDKYILFSVGTATRTLINNGIKPDFIAVIELYDCSSQIEGLDLSDINIILEPYTNHSFHKLKAKEKLLIASNNSLINIAWSNLFNTDISMYKIKGNVSYLATFAAKMLGFKKIILTGQDLAFTNGRCYSKESKYSDLILELNKETNKVEITAKNGFEAYGKALLPETETHTKEEYIQKGKENIERFNRTLYYVKGIDGTMLPTEGGYATFIENFKAFAAENSELDLINTSLIGANIYGFKNIPLENTLKDLPKCDFLNEFIEKTSFDKKDVKRKLEHEIIALTKLQEALIEGNKISAKLLRDFSRNKFTKETGKFLKELTISYQKINEIKIDSLFFETLSLAWQLDVNYYMKLIEDNADEKTLTDFGKELGKYFENLTFYIERLINDIKGVKM